jgi:hypothetical protein
MAKLGKPRFGILKEGISPLTTIICHFFLVAFNFFSAVLGAATFKLILKLSLINYLILRKK